MPLNIFEDRYIQLINDSMKENRMFGMVQPKNKKSSLPEVYKIGCLGKIVSFNETKDKRFIISLSGIIRFKIKNEIKEEKLNLDQLINTVSMISPFSVEEKQKLIETIKIEDKIKILSEIISFNLIDFEENKTVQ